MADSAESHFHNDQTAFRAALDYAAATTHFSARLIEKDYFCSLVLRELEDMFRLGLVFKGGTCLSKVHSEFFRLSEDLDFTVPIAVDAGRPDRRRAVDPFKAIFERLPERFGNFQLTSPITGHDASRQYNGQLSYRSVISGELDYLKIEISVREPLLLAAETLPARTLLLDPITRKPVLAPFPVTVLSLREAYAEKIRAALTRKEPAIRDFFDIDNALGRNVLPHTDADFINLVLQKLAVAANDPPDLSDGKVARLRAQMEGQLKPVLRLTEYDQFDLDRAVRALKEIEARCQR